ncbi:lachesin-like isoform X2 [Nilaparvata lugens]|uniref:lachesin-like isoform X2 n=1 Tax=Nilaparvata lugens TaxID=108931 RepID=UPI00193E2664|nr:lachesin-like isoform X2 [Nilaparvata lugens]
MSHLGRQLPLDLLLMTIIVNSALSTGPNNEGPNPEFIRPIGNVTVPIGKEAVLTCAVSDLGNYRLGWVRLSDQTILSLHTQVVTPSSRFLTTYDNQNQWKLHIKGVTEKDIGCYMCQINTKVMKNQIGCLEVHVPPDIKEAGTSGDLVAKEGSNVTLSCNASGVPRPRVTWKREYDHTVAWPGDFHVGDSSHSINKTMERQHGHSVSWQGDSYVGDSVYSLNITGRREGGHTVAWQGDSYVGDSVHSINITGRHEGVHTVAWPDDSYVGDSIYFVNISRKQIGNYLCIASNEVPPAVSKRIMLTVQFEPKLTVENDVVGALLGDLAYLSCTAEMLPVTSVYWSKNDSKLGARHKIEDSRSSYIWQTKLIITNVSSEDFGFYLCTANNEDKRLTALVRLYQIIASTTKPVPSTTTETTTIITTVKARTRRPRVTTTTEKAPLNYQVAVGVKEKQEEISVSDPISGRHSDVTVISSKASIHHTVAQICLPGLFWLMSHDTALL